MQIIKSEELSKTKARYIIVDDNGNIIDDAQGYGFKNRGKARNSNTYRNWKKAGKVQKPKKKNGTKKKEQKISRATRETLITVVKSESLSTPEQDRYVIIDRFSRKVVDNANGRGYRTRVAAYSAWTWIKRKVRGEL